MNPLLAKAAEEISGHLDELIFDLDRVKIEKCVAMHLAQVDAAMERLAEIWSNKVKECRAKQAIYNQDAVTFRQCETAAEVYSTCIRELKALAALNPKEP